MLVSCQTEHRSLLSVWNKSGQPTIEIATPHGFTVSPLEAFRIAQESGRLSLKHHWHIYSDTKFYYIHDTFLGDGTRRAFKQGLRIDGKTGKIQEGEQVGAGDAEEAF